MGYGFISGQIAYMFSQDCTIFGGSLFSIHAKKNVQGKKLHTAVPGGAQ